jgi:predicted metalloprotease with PDZ domain
VPYTFDDIVNGLNAIAPNDWAAFLRKRLDSNDVHAPEVDGINALSGYKLIYTDKPDYWSQLLESQHNYVDVRYSLGMSVGTDGKVKDVIVGGLADKAGFGPDMQIIAVNGRGFTPLLLRAAIQQAQGNGPAIEFIVENTNYYKVIRMDYHGGERYPQLQRVDATPARLDDILQPMVK